MKSLTTPDFWTAYQALPEFDNIIARFISSRRSPWLAGAFSKVGFA